MKKLISFIVLNVFFFSCRRILVDFTKLQDRTGIFFLINVKNPFTRSSIHNFNDALIFEVSFNDILHTDYRITFYSNRQINTARTYIDGLNVYVCGLFGKRTFYDKNVTVKDPRYYKCSCCNNTYFETFFKKMRFNNYKVVQNLDSACPYSQSLDYNVSQARHPKDRKAQLTNDYALQGGRRRSQFTVVNEHFMDEDNEACGH